MTMTKNLQQLRAIPAALRRADAAVYCGVSATYFVKMVESGVFPQPRVAGKSVKLWLRNDLDDALFCLPEADEAQAYNPCDRLIA